MENDFPRLCRRRIRSHTSSRSIGISGTRITSAPPAIPENVAIHPACRPITSTTMTRLCDSAVVWIRSMASVAVETAVSKPKVKSVPDRSLSIVLGTPTTGSPISYSFDAAPRVSSPPTAIRASSPRIRRFFSALSGPPASLNGLVREVPMIVPPMWRIPETILPSRSIGEGSSSPFHPFRSPTTRELSVSDFRTTARITALRPGQSPPPVKTPIFIADIPPQTKL